MTVASYTLLKGTSPLLISMPHNGVDVPADIQAKMTKAGLAVADTDWYMDKLYDFAQAMGAWILIPRYSRYVIDLNREPNGIDLYPGAQSTELCPTTSFANEDLYFPGQQPSKDEISFRVANYFKPYHQAIADTLAAIQKQHGKAVLLEAHSIASRVPRFFEGQLPDFNFGNNDGNSCGKDLIAAIERIDFAPYSQVVNGRFKGGHITRAYADVENNIHTIQLELSQRTYLKEPSNEYDLAAAQQVKVKLKDLVTTLTEFSLQP